MLRIRLVEERISELYSEQEMRCPVHLSTGQEAAAVGACAALDASDVIVSNHRSHSHYLAKGGNLENAIVVKDNEILNSDGLRNKKEFVNHKILDCMGDLYLAGYKIIGKLVCSQGGHKLTNQLLRVVVENKEPSL